MEKGFWTPMSRRLKMGKITKNEEYAPPPEVRVSDGREPLPGADSNADPRELLWRRAAAGQQLDSGLLSVAGFGEPTEGEEPTPDGPAPENSIRVRLGDGRWMVIWNYTPNDLQVRWVRTTEPARILVWVPTEDGPSIAVEENDVETWTAESPDGGLGVIVGAGI